MLQGNDVSYGGNARILDLPDGVLPQQPCTMAQFQAAIEGLSWKDNARVAAQVNVTVSSPGAAIDGQTLAVNDPVLLRNQTATSENGKYVWNGAATPMTRSADMSVSAEFNSAVVGVDAGTDAGTLFRQTAVNPTVGTTPILWVSFGTTAPAASTGTAGVIALATQAEVNTGTATNKAVTPETAFNATWRGRKFAVNIGDGTSTLLTVTHNLGTEDVLVLVYRNSGLKDLISVDVERNTINSVQVRFAAGLAPSAAGMRVVVMA